jgi:hypothetical protein
MLGAEPELKWPSWRSDYATVFTTGEAVFDSRHGTLTGSGANPARSYFGPEASWVKIASVLRDRDVEMRRAVTSWHGVGEHWQICLHLLESLLHWGNGFVTWCHKAEKKRRPCVFPHFEFWTSGLIFTKFGTIVVIGGHSRDVLKKYLPSGHGGRTNLRGGSSTSAMYTTCCNAELQ